MTAAIYVLAHGRDVAQPPSAVTDAAEARAPVPQVPTAPPEVKWRCAHCGSAFQEIRAFRAEGKVEIRLLCHRCKRLNDLRQGR